MERQAPGDRTYIYGTDVGRYGTLVIAVPVHCCKRALLISHCARHLPYTTFV